MHLVFLLFSGFRALFTKPVSIFFLYKNNFKTGFYGTIYAFKNYFVIIFLIFNYNLCANMPYIRKKNS